MVHTGSLLFLRYGGKRWKGILFAHYQLIMTDGYVALDFIFVNQVCQDACMYKDKVASETLRKIHEKMRLTLSLIHVNALYLHEFQRFKICIDWDLVRFHKKCSERFQAVFKLFAR